MNSTIQTIKNGLKLVSMKMAKVNLKHGAPKIYIQEGKTKGELRSIGLTPGTRYKTEVKKDSHEIWFVADSNEGYNTVSYRKVKDDTIGVIDRGSSEIGQALKDCSNVTVTFYIDEETGNGMVKVSGIKATAQIINEEIEKERKSHVDYIENLIGTPYERTHGTKNREITCMSWCSGTGLSDMCNERAGFKVVAACEYNPKHGLEDKFAEIYKANHPETIIFNIPMQLLKAEDLPTVDYWLCTLDCSDYSKLASTKKEFGTMHLYLTIVRLFYQLPVEKRPKAILIENVEAFEKYTGNSLKLLFEDEGFHVKMAKIDSLDYGSRTRRERFFFVASIFEGFEFPMPTGRLETPISSDGIMTVDTLNWITPDQHSILRHFVEREKGEMTHNHKMIKYNIDKDSYIGTIPKSHCNYVPENILIHPSEPNKYAFIRKEEHLKYLHDIDQNYYLGENENVMIQAIGQGIDCHLFQNIVNTLYKHLYYNLFEKPIESVKNKIKEVISNNTEESSVNLELDGDQFRFAL